jgi:hypothetical protein
MASFAIDPLNLIRVMPAKGRKTKPVLLPCSPVLAKKKRMNQVREKRSSNSLESSPSGPFRRVSSQPQVLDIARIGAFSALVAVGTLISNLLFGVTLPPPLGEITAAPAFYMAIAVLFSRKVSFWSIAIGSAVGEAVSIFVLGQVPAAFALTFIPGIVLARAPESLIIYRFRDGTRRVLAFGMVLATIFETVVFFLIDWPVYSFTSFYCTDPTCTSLGLFGGFLAAAPDFATMIDVVWVPVALILAVAARRSFRVQHFS